MTGKNRIIIQVGGILHNSCSKFSNVLRIAGENQKKKFNLKYRKAVVHLGKRNTNGKL